MRVRRARIEDIPQIHDAHMRSIREVCAPDYTPEQIQAWGGRTLDVAHRTKTVVEEFVWVVEDGDRVEGYGHMARIEAGQRDVEIQGLYLTRAALGQGLGKSILQAMEQEARARGVAALRLSSTVTAKAFYESQGFTPLGGCELKTIRGVGIPCHPMAKALT